MRVWQPYFVWGVASVFVLYQFSMQVSVAVFSKEIQTDLHATVTSVGVLTALFSVAYAMMQVPVGVMLDRWSPRLLMTISALVCAAGACVFAMSDSLVFAGLGRLLMGLGASFSFVGASFLAGRWIPKEKFALFVGLTEMTGVAGAAGFDLLSRYLESHVTWRTQIGVSAVFGFILAGTIWAVVRDHPADQPPPKHTSQSNLAKSVGELVMNRQIWLVGGFYFLSMGVLLGFAGLWNATFQYAYDLPVEEVAVANALIFLGWAIGSPVAGWLAGRYSVKKLILVGVIGHLVVTGAIFFTGMLPLGVIYLLRFGFGLFGGMNILAFAVAGRAAPASLSGTALGIINTMGFAGVTLLQTFPGLLLAGDTQAHGWPEMAHALTIYLGALTIAAIFACMLKDPNRESEQ
ncbi:MFS transporter [Cerasicoccus fimbriatus]|uniref:MFS transporter n=1 Tax=Cerasicoccus fimbriatus TaxID=3014554 RepID=UPI0022B3A979|nr:MFS transporter [Cerasicoccus sp. TK19100]